MYNLCSLEPWAVWFLCFPRSGCPAFFLFFELGLTFQEVPLCLCWPELRVLSLACGEPYTTSILEGDCEDWLRTVSSSRHIGGCSGNMSSFSPVRWGQRPEKAEHGLQEALHRACTGKKNSLSSHPVIQERQVRLGLAYHPVPLPRLQGGWHSWFRVPLWSLPPCQGNR